MISEYSFKPISLLICVVSSKEQLLSQCKILFLDTLQVLLSNNSFSLLNYFVTLHILTCQVFAAPCAEDPAAPAAPG